MFNRLFSIAVFICLFAVPAFASVPVAHWNLDESSGFMAVDSVGSSDFQIYNITDSDWAVGVFGNALYFNISNEVYAEASSFYFLNNSDFSVSFWFRYDAYLVSDGFLFSKSDFDTYEGYESYLGFGYGGVYIGTVVYDGNNSLESEIVNVTQDQWHHYVFSKNGSSCSVYVDDELNYTSELCLFDFSDTYPMVMSAPPSVGAFFSGYMDEVWLFEGSLSSEEVGNLYLLNQPPVPEDEPEATPLESMLADVGVGIGALLSAVASPLGEISLVLGIVGGVIAIFLGIAYAIRRGLSR